MNLNQLLYFSVTARHQHFTRAAEELFISQPSLSYAISSLEDELGVALFQKRGRNVALTQQGELFLAHVERALSEIQQGREALTRMTSETENSLRLAAFSTSLGTENLPDLIREFTAQPQNGDIHFQFHQCTEAEMADGLKSMQYDAVFTSRYPDSTNFDSIPLYSGPLVAVVPKNHPLADCESIDLQTLGQYPLIVREHSPSAHQIEHLLETPRIISRVQDMLALLSLAAADFGVAICVPTQTISGFPLRAIPIITPGCSYTIQMIWKKDRYFSPAFERFIEFFRKRAKTP